MSADDRERARATLAILEQADQALEGWRCESSTDCCRFAVTGREPWLTEAEWSLLVREVARQGRKLPVVRDDRVCSFLSDSGRCTVYAVRPLGCRTFYCERATGPAPFPRKTLMRLPRELDAMSRIDRAEDRGGRPISSWLAAARRRK